MEYGPGIIGPGGKVMVKEERSDGQITERRHDAYQGICLKAQLSADFADALAR